MRSAFPSYNVKTLRGVLPQLLQVLTPHDAHAGGLLPVSGQWLAGGYMRLKPGWPRFGSVVGRVRTVDASACRTGMPSWRLCSPTRLRLGAGGQRRVQGFQTR